MRICAIIYWIAIDEEVIRGKSKNLCAAETLNKLLEAEVEKLTRAARYERSEQRQDYCSDHYSHNLTTASGDVIIKIPRLKGGF